jgi:hypothetical protein
MSFACGVRQGTNYVLLYVETQFSQCLLLNGLSFPIVYPWYLCWKSVDQKCTSLFWGLHSICLCICFYVSAIQFLFLYLEVNFEIRSFDTSGFLILFWILWLFGIYCGSKWILGLFFPISLKNATGNLMRIALSL